MHAVCRSRELRICFSWPKNKRRRDACDSICGILKGRQKIKTMRTERKRNGESSRTCMMWWLIGFRNSCGLLIFDERFSSLSFSHMILVNLLFKIHERYLGAAFWKSDLTASVTNHDDFLEQYSVLLHSPNLCKTVNFSHITTSITRRPTTALNCY